VFDCDVLTLDEAYFLQALAERCHQLGVVGERPSAEKPDHRLLRPRCDRPSNRRAAEQRDEVAPIHCLMPPVLSTERIAHLGTAGDCRAAAFQSSRCRSWVRTDKIP